MNLILEILLLVLMMKMGLIGSDEGSKREIARSTFGIQEMLLLLMLMLGRVEQGSLIVQRSIAGALEADWRRDLRTKATERGWLGVCC